MKKILFYSNIYTPYQCDWLKSLNNYFDSRALFLKNKEKNRDWNIDLDSSFTILYGNLLIKYMKIFFFILKYKPTHIIIGGYSERGTNLVHLLGVALNCKVYYWLERPMRKRSVFLNFFKNILLKLKLGNCNGILAIGKLAQYEYQNYNNFCINYPYSCDLTEFYKLNKLISDNKKLKVLFSGQYIERKNVVNLIKAVNSFENDIELTMIGGGDLYNEIDKLKSDNIKILPFLQKKEMLECFEQNDVFILPSRHDGWALVINEAAASGLYILSNNNVGAFDDLEEILNCTNCGVNVNEIKSCLQKIIKLDKSYIREQGIKNKDIISKTLADCDNAAKFIFEKI